MLHDWTDVQVVQAVSDKLYCVPYSTHRQLDLQQEKARSPGCSQAARSRDPACGPDWSGRSLIVMSTTGQELTPVLQHAQSADSGLRTQAELQLQAYQQQDYAGYLVALVSELANDAKPPETRQIAGLLLKNMLDATDAALKVSLCGDLDALLPITLLLALSHHAKLFAGGHAGEVGQR